MFRPIDFENSTQRFQIIDRNFVGKIFCHVDCMKIHEKLKSFSSSFFKIVFLIRREGNRREGNHQELTEGRWVRKTVKFEFFGKNKVV